MLVLYMVSPRKKASVLCNKNSPFLFTVIPK